jgi:hypothetical protein
MNTNTRQLAQIGLGLTGVWALLLGQAIPGPAA